MDTIPARSIMLTERLKTDETSIGAIAVKNTPTEALSPVEAMSCQDFTR